MLENDSLEKRVEVLESEIISLRKAVEKAQQGTLNESNEKESGKNKMIPFSQKVKVVLSFILQLMLLPVVIVPVCGFFIYVTYLYMKLASKIIPGFDF